MHTFATSSYIDATEGKQKRMKRYFNKDRLGLKKIPTSDAACWKVVTVAQEDAAALATASTAKLPSKSKGKKGHGSGKKQRRKRKRKRRKEAKKAAKAEAKRAKQAAKAKAAAMAAAASGATGPAESAPAPMPLGTQPPEELTATKEKSAESDSASDSGLSEGGPRKIPVQTEFYTDLQAMQEKYYMYLRASVVLYMDDRAKEHYKTVLAQADIVLSLPMDQKYSPGKRISWKKIKNLILNDICRETHQR